MSRADALLKNAAWTPAEPTDSMVSITGSSNSEISMNQQKSTVAPGTFEGNMFLYTQPELLTVKHHGHLGINTSTRPYDFAKSIRVVPIAAAEIVPAQRNYPIIFSDLAQPALMAVVAVLEDVNLFVDENGEWDKSAYIPAYIRCHPFALATRPENDYSVIIDRAASSLSENAEQPLFDGEKLSPPIQARVDFCTRFTERRQASKTFCDRMVELGLLSGQRMTFKPDDGGEEQSVGPYVAVDFDKLKELAAETLQQLHLDGTLSAIYAHCFSQDNWSRLLERRNLRRSGH